jgi:hypothetical protein
MGAAMQTSDVKSLLGITSTNTDTQIAALLYPSASFADEYCNYGLSRFLYHRDDVTVALSASSSAAYITNLSSTTSTSAPFQWISRDTVVVWSSDASKRYEEDRDYEIDYEAGTIVPLEDSTNGTSTGANVLIDFAYVDLSGSRKAAQVAVAQLVWGTMNIKPGIASESAGPLSRSYIQDGIPPQVSRILKPFRRPVMK